MAVKKLMLQFAWSGPSKTRRLTRLTNILYDISFSHTIPEFENTVEAKTWCHHKVTSPPPPDQDLPNTRTSLGPFGVLIREVWLYTIKRVCFEIFQCNSKAWSLPTSTRTKMAIWRILVSIQNEANWLVALRSKEFWLDQGNYATLKLESRSVLVE